MVGDEYIMVHIDTVLCILLQVCILNGNAMLLLVKWNLYIAYEKAM